MKKIISQTAVSLVLITLMGMVATLPAQERVQEKVDVSWWVIPLFAVSSDGKSIADLKEEDIGLMLDKKEIKEFILYKKSFSASTAEEKKPAIVPPEEKEKLIFLLFDTALTTKESTQRAQKIAREIVLKADKNNSFIIMKISPNAGLVYAGGPLKDKKRVLNLIEKGVLVKGMDQQSVLGYVLDASAGGGHSKYEGDEIRSEVNSFLVPHLTRPLKRKNISFFNSFETLFYAVNTLKSNKFIYLFTEGINKISMMGDKASTYNFFLKKVADSLSQSGAVLFILNPATVDPGRSQFSGEDSLRYLAKESGGKYIEGADEEIVDRIENMHRAYYEIGFSDLPESKKNARRVTIKSKRKGIKIHTLRSLKEKSGYAHMKKMEKEFLALNLIGKNPLFKLTCPSRDIQVDKIEPAGDETIYHVTLPEIFSGRSSDLFRIHIGKKSRQADIEKQTQYCPDRKMVFKMKNLKGKENHFVLLNGVVEEALIGRFDYLENGAIAGFKSLEDGSLVVSAISLPQVEFKQSTLFLMIEGFLLRSTAKGPAGKLHINVSIRNMQGIELFNQEKALLPQKETVTASLPFKWLAKGNYKIVVKVKDLLTGKTAVKSIRPRFDH